MLYVLTKFKAVKMRMFYIAVSMLWLYVLISYIFLEVWLAKNGKMVLKSVVLPYVVVHIDLKGTPLKLSYLSSILPTLKENGVNGLLMEYEDMFPYEGKLANLSAENCYKKIELKRFLALANRSGFTVIPLVQTFGHLEYALKLEEFQHLREDPLYSDSICPSKKETMAFLKHVLEQVIDFHSAILPLKFIHVGCDEVFHINKCQHCEKRSLSDTEIFLHHIKTLSDVVKSLNKDTTVLIWDDMLRGIKPEKWVDINYFNNVQPVCWDYNNNLHVSHTHLYRYHNQFNHIWIASAFKGADGRTATFPNTRNRFFNTFSWMDFIIDYKFGGETEVFVFKGIILTGWSRYSHMDPPCELLPIAIPSLIIDLLVIQKFKAGVRGVDRDLNRNVFDDFVNKHTCANISVNTRCLMEFDNYDCTMNCDVAANELYIALKKLFFFTSEYAKSLYDDETGCEFLEYYSKKGLINANIVFDHIDIINNYLQQLNELEFAISRELSKYYEDDFITEYVTYKTIHMKMKLQSLLDSLNNNLKVRTWHRRPKNISYFALN